MKKQILLLLAACTALLAQAQTGPLLLGATTGYGTNNSGSIVSHVGSTTGLQQVFGFPANSAGFGPGSSNLVQAPDGKLYGLDGSDGSADGTLYAYDVRTNTYTVMVNFDSATTGSSPQGGLMMASNGLMYGLTFTGDSTNGGTLFSYAPDSSYVTTLAVLPVSANPISTMIQASNGMLYGLTQFDGTDSSGTLFQFDIATNTYSILYTFSSHSEPTGSLLEMGADTLYGMTTYGGSASSGIIFQYVISSNTFTTLYNMATNAFPSSGPVNIGGVLYGVTYGDGANSDGTIFSFSVGTGAYTDLYDMGNAANDGTFPFGNAMVASNGKIYATANQGGLYGLGAIFSYNVATSTYTREADLDTLNGGSFSFGTLTEYLSSPQILAQPSALYTCVGSQARFAAAAGGPDVSAQWQVSVNGGTTFSNVTGADSGVYSFTAASVDSGYVYRAIFTNAYGADTSAAVTLSVGSPLYDSAVVSAAVCSVTPISGASYQWIRCADKLPVNNGTAQSYTAIQNGDYQCVVTSGGCIDTTNCVAVVGVGIDEVPGYNFSLYPDPSNGVFTITNDYPGLATVRIINMLGASLKEFSMSGAQVQFDITDLAAGIYEVQIGDGARLLKVLKVVRE